MNAILGGSLLILGFFFADQVLEMFGLLPVWVLGGFLAYAGLRHAMLVLDLEPFQIALAIGAAAVGIWTSNLAYTTAIALVIAHVPTLTDRVRHRRAQDVTSS